FLFIVPHTHTTYTLSLHDALPISATYDRVLKNIAGQKITIHCTVTGQMMKRPGYLKKFLEYWTPRAEVHKVWFSLFTPQVGDRLDRKSTRLNSSHVEISYAVFCLK